MCIYICVFTKCCLFNMYQNAIQDLPCAHCSRKGKGPGCACWRVGSFACSHWRKGCGRVRCRAPGHIIPPLLWHLPTISFVIGSGALAPIAPRDIQVVSSLVTCREPWGEGQHEWSIWGRKRQCVPKELASLVPSFDPAVDNVEIWTSKVELLVTTWAPSTLAELATLNCKGTATILQESNAWWNW